MGWVEALVLLGLLAMLTLGLALHLMQTVGSVRWARKSAPAGRLPKRDQRYVAVVVGASIVVSILVVILALSGWRII